MKRILYWVLAIVIAFPLGIMGFEYLHRPAHIDATTESTNTKNQQGLISKGHYLVQAGDCIACHTAQGETPYAGGRPIHTPFGTLYSPNLTPDKQTGLGKWSANDFWNALHEGVSQDGHFLYPAFPYPNYTQVTRADSDAMYAYLQTLTPAHHVNQEPELEFPYNLRPLLSFWRFLYFRPETFQPDQHQTVEWNRGAYLVQGLGHCNACHAVRNQLGAIETQNELSGSFMFNLNWYAPSLTSSTQSGLGNWTESAIVDLLKSGISQKGAVFGPMAEVVYASLQHLTNSDAQAIAVYLKSVPAETPLDVQRPPQAPGYTTDKMLALGKYIYHKYCLECHQANGLGIPPHYPPLAGNHAITMYSAVNPIRMVLHGGFPPATAKNPRPYGMPPFRQLLSNEEVAAVVSYILASWGNQLAPVSPMEVERYRSIPE